MKSKVSSAAIIDIFQVEFWDSFDSNSVGYDIVMPIKNTNGLFKYNLTSIYRHIPVNRLLVGDAGCDDNSLEVLEDFPRVNVYDHKHFKTSGVCIADLISKVQTEHFFYLHADIFIPDSETVETLVKRMDQADWLEGFRKHLTILEHSPERYYTDKRSYSGMQFGKSSLLQNAVQNIKDGELQRNEDIVIAELVEKQNGSFLKVKESVHVHQVMNKDESHEPPIKSVQYIREENKEWSAENWRIHIRGIVLHTEPKPHLVLEVLRAMVELSNLQSLRGFSVEIKELALLRPAWSKYLQKGSAARIYFLLPFRNRALFMLVCWTKLKQILKRLIHN